MLFHLALLPVALKSGHINEEVCLLGFTLFDGMAALVNTWCMTVIKELKVKEIIQPF